MARNITFTEFIRRVAQHAKVSERTVRKVYNSLFDITAEELRFTDSVRWKRFGTFNTLQRGGKDMPIPNPDGTRTIKYVEPYQRIVFKPAGEFTNYANGKIVDKESKRRIREGRPSAGDKKLASYKPEGKDNRLALGIEKILSKKLEVDVDIDRDEIAESMED